MRKTVLIIDDDEYFSRLVGLILQREDIAVEFAGDGQAGIERVRIAPPDLVILDYVMPAMDGLEVCREKAGETRLREVVTSGGFSLFRRATETPFNLVLEARP